jgi:hypothetical protein
MIITAAVLLDKKTNNNRTKAQDKRESLTWSLIADFSIATIVTLAVCFA